MFERNLSHRSRRLMRGTGPTIAEILDSQEFRDTFARHLEEELKKRREAEQKRYPLSQFFNDIYHGRRQPE